jgi:uncharacterized membrane protein
MSLYTGSGILLILLAIPLYLEKIKPNGLYGFRVRKTIENPELWYPVNKYGARWLMLTGLVVVFSAIGFTLVPGLSVDGYSEMCTLVFAVVMTVGLVFTMGYMNSL